MRRQLLAAAYDATAPCQRFHPNEHYWSLLLLLLRLQANDSRLLTRAINKAVSDTTSNLYEELGRGKQVCGVVHRCPLCVFGACLYHVLQTFGFNPRVPNACRA